VGQRRVSQDGDRIESGPEREDERVERARDGVRALISVPWGERSRDAVNSRPSVSGTVTRRSTVPRGVGLLTNGALSRASEERAPTLACGAPTAVVPGLGVLEGRGAHVGAF
jgi:hypothetical protein